jgi:hypothetical protein
MSCRGALEGGSAAMPSRAKAAGSRTPVACSRQFALACPRNTQGFADHRSLRGVRASRKECASWTCTSSTTPADTPGGYIGSSGAPLSPPLTMRRKDLTVGRVGATWHDHPGASCRPHPARRSSRKYEALLRHRPKRNWALGVQNTRRPTIRTRPQWAHDPAEGRQATAPARQRCLRSQGLPRPSRRTPTRRMRRRVRVRMAQVTVLRTGMVRQQRGLLKVHVLRHPRAHPIGVADFGALGP